MAYAAAIAAIVPIIMKATSSSDQKNQAKDLSAGLGRPFYKPQSYQIPKEVDEMLNRTKTRSVDSRLPGMGAIENKLDANTANATAAAKESGGSSNDVLNTIASIYGKQMETTSDLGVKAATNYQDLVQKKNADVYNALGNSASFKDRKQSIDSGNYDKSFQVNQLDPYKATAATISSLTNSSAQNKFGAGEDLATLGALIAQLNANTDGGSNKKKPRGATDQDAASLYSSILSNSSQGY